MQALTTLSVLLLCGLTSARDIRLSESCLRGETHRDVCCESVPDAWHAHLRNPNDCASFYQCEHGKPTWKACATGTHWSVAADRCDWPHEANCVLDGPSTAHPPTETPVDECVPEPVSHQCLNGSLSADLCCRDTQSYHKLKLADAQDCNGYYQCVDGHAVHRQCPEGLHWSVDTERCEWPQVAECSGGNGGSNGGNNGDGGSVSSDCLSGKVSAEECCKGVPSTFDLLLQNNADCHTYIQCVNEKSMVRPCPAGLWWSITRNRCEWIENATCTW